MTPTIPTEIVPPPLRSGSIVQRIGEAWLCDGLKGKTLQATLRLYLFGVIMLVPFAAIVGMLFGAKTAFQATPLLVLSLVGLEYGLCSVVQKRKARQEQSVEASRGLTRSQSQDRLRENPLPEAFRFELERRVLEELKHVCQKSKQDRRVLGELQKHPLIQCTFTGVSPQDEWILEQLLAAPDWLEACPNIDHLVTYLRQLKREADEAVSGLARSS